MVVSGTAVPLRGGAGIEPTKPSDYTALPVLKTGSPTRELPPRAEGYGPRLQRSPFGHGPAWRPRRVARTSVRVSESELACRERPRVDAGRVQHERDVEPRDHPGESLVRCRGIRHRQAAEGSKVDGMIGGGVPITIAISRPSASSISVGSPLDALSVDVEGDRSGRLAVAADAVRIRATSHCVKNCPSTFGVGCGRLRVDDAVRVVRVERRDAWRRALLLQAPADSAAVEVEDFATGFGVDADSGRHLNRVPFTNTSRCACTWYCKRSAGSGVSPAFSARPIGSGGNGQGAAPVAGVAAAGTLAVAAVVDVRPRWSTRRRPSRRCRRTQPAPRRAVQQLAAGVAWRDVNSADDGLVPDAVRLVGVGAEPLVPVLLVLL